MFYRNSRSDTTVVGRQANGQIIETSCDIVTLGYEMSPQQMLVLDVLEKWWLVKVNIDNT